MLGAMVQALIICLVLLLAPTWAFAHGSEEDGLREHVVYKGQRLGSIAKRYNVTIEAICHANGIRRQDPIRPRQRLLIPTRSDKDGSQARALRVSGKWPPKDDSSQDDEPSRSVPLQEKPRVHTVYSGQRLGSIAKRYNATVSAICKANGIKARDPIKPKQQLFIPPRTDRDGTRTLAWRLQSTGGGSGRNKGRRGSWTKYAKAPKKRGYVTMVGYNQRWTGYVIGPRQRVLGKAKTGISQVLTAPSNRQPVNPRLIQILAQVSDTFGGRPLEIVSGYRTTSFVKNSRHKSGRAVDFRISGIPNEALRDYLRTLDNVGVGYYPNSTFVHLDVRQRTTYWVDYAGPGEAPRLVPR